MKKTSFIIHIDKPCKNLLLFRREQHVLALEARGGPALGVRPGDGVRARVLDLKPGTGLHN